MERPIISTIPTVFNLEKAKDIAAVLTSGDRDGWQYNVVPQANGETALIRVHEADGTFVAYF